MPSSRDIRCKWCHRGRSCEPTFVGVVGAAALVGAFVGAITGALQVLLRNRDSDSDMVEQRLGQPPQCAAEFTHAKVGSWPSTSVQQCRSDFCCWSKSRGEARIAQTTLMTRTDIRPESQLRGIVKARRLPCFVTIRGSLPNILKVFKVFYLNAAEGVALLFVACNLKSFVTSAGCIGFVPMQKPTS